MNFVGIFFCKDNGVICEYNEYSTQLLITVKHVFLMALQNEFEVKNCFGWLQVLIAGS